MRAARSDRAGRRAPRHRPRPRPRPRLRAAVRLSERRREPAAGHRGPRPGPVRHPRPLGDRPGPAAPHGPAGLARTAHRGGARTPPAEPVVARTGPGRGASARRRHPRPRARRTSAPAAGTAPDGRLRRRVRPLHRPAGRPAHRRSPAHRLPAREPRGRRTLLRRLRPAHRRTPGPALRRTRGPGARPAARGPAERRRDRPRHAARGTGSAGTGVGGLRRARADHRHPAVRPPVVRPRGRRPAGAGGAPARHGRGARLGGRPSGRSPAFDLAATVAPYHLPDERVTRAARAARDLAAFEGAELTAAHLRAAARRQSASGLEQHARRIRPAVDWTDLVLPERPLTQLRELALRARHRDRVLGDWRLSAGGGRGRGVLGLFAGESGTGKTLSAEVVAAELGLDLYVVQLSSVVDKYVGETEKNLERIFTEADRTDAVLLFDEADAVFGKRSEVKDSHDRYANMESAYLLQRLESFDGIALLTTNLRANIDEAFTRRLDLVVDFPFPDAGQRLALWRHSLSHVPCGDGIELGALSADFELAGGSIRSAVVTAAYLAAGRGGTVTAADLLEGARREYRKAGRLLPGDGSW
ncbi:AAA family ATPase [Streptomyces sp. e14]|nr:AAA family ATPase [Streptomyces sp. e14]